MGRLINRTELIVTTEPTHSAVAGVVIAHAWSADGLPSGGNMPTAQAKRKIDKIVV